MKEFSGVPLPDSAPPITVQDRDEFVRLLRPVMAPQPLIRIGGNGDGAYLLPDDLDGIAACISPGVSNRKDFEDELARDFGIASHMCDFSSDVSHLKTPLIEGMQSFRKCWLDLPGTADSISLDEFVDQTCPPERDLILQMDIEGAEYRNILHASPQVLGRFRIIAIELHLYRALNSPKIFHGVVMPVIRKLSDLFYCVHMHPNNCCGSVAFKNSNISFPRVPELTFLRKDRFPADQLPVGTSRLPHPLDIGRNLRGKPPLFMDAFWCEGGVRSDDAQIKHLTDQLEYAQEQLRKYGHKETTHG